MGLGRGELEAQDFKDIPIAVAVIDMEGQVIVFVRGHAIPQRTVSEVDAHVASDGERAGCNTDGPQVGDGFLFAQVVVDGQGQRTDEGVGQRCAIDPYVAYALDRVHHVKHFRG